MVLDYVSRLQDSPPLNSEKHHVMYQLSGQDKVQELVNYLKFTSDAVTATRVYVWFVKPEVSTILIAVFRFVLTDATKNANTDTKLEVITGILLSPSKQATPFTAVPPGSHHVVALPSKVCTD